jgi:hypothetical protein
VIGLVIDVDAINNGYLTWFQLVKCSHTNIIYARLFSVKKFLFFYGYIG